MHLLLVLYSNAVFSYFTDVNGPVPTAGLGLANSDPPWGGFNSSPYPSYHLSTPAASPLQSSGYTPYATDMASLADSGASPMSHLPSGEHLFVFISQ